MRLLANPTLRLFIGAALISLSPIWVRLVDVAPSVSGFYRVAIGGLVLVIYLLATRRRLLMSQRLWALMFLAAFMLALDLWFWHRSIIYIGPGLSTLIANFQVFIMMFAGIIFLGEMPRPVQILAVPLALLGLLLIVGLEWDALSAEYRWGIGFGFLTAASYAAYLLTLRAIRAESNFRIPTRELAVISVICAVMMAVSVMAEGGSLIIPGYKDLGWLVGYGVLSHCIGWLFIASSLAEVSAVEAGLALLLQPTLSFVWDVLLFSRPTSAIELLGAGIALLAIYLGSRSASKQA